jgi:hypothetical protein
MKLTAQMLKYEAQRVSSAMLLRVVVRSLILAAAAWAAATSALVWYWTGYYCGPIAHQYFTEWVVGWFFTEELPVPFLSLPYRGSRYPVDTLYGFLNQHVFKASPGTWFEYYAGWGLVTLLGVTGLALLAAAVRCLDWSRSDRDKANRETTHIRGLKLVSPYRLRRQLRGDGVVIAGVPIPRVREAEHFLIAGATGTGKSVAIRTILRQVARRGETAVVVDPDCEFAPEFYHPERGDVLLNPLDARCPVWTPWGELDVESFDVDAEMLAAAMIPDPPGAHGEDGSAFFFRQSSRTLITALLRVADPATPASLPTLLNLPRSELKKRLVGTPAEPLIDPGAHDQGAGIVATAANAINPLRYLPAASAFRWSARAWAPGARGWIFLTSRDDLAVAIMPLLSVWLDCIVRRLLAQSAPRDRVWIVVDELAALKRQAQLENLLVRGRKRQLAAVIGFQTVSQLRAIYGREQASVLCSMPSTKLLLRVDEAETAELLSRQIGEREAARDQLGANAGERSALTLHETRSLEALVLPSEIQGLPRLSGYLCVAGADRARVQLPLSMARDRYPAHVALPGGPRRTQTQIDADASPGAAAQPTFREHT